MIPGHVKSMTNISLVRCKMRKITSLEQNNKPIPIGFFFAKQKGPRSPHQTSTEEGHQSCPSRRVLLDGSVISYKVWRQALKVRELCQKTRPVGIVLVKKKSRVSQNVSQTLLAKCKSSTAQNISRESRKKIKPSF